MQLWNTKQRLWKRIAHSSDGIVRQSARLQQMPATTLRASVSPSVSAPAPDAGPLTVATAVEIMPVVVEAIRRSTGMSLYPVQITAAIATALGHVIEMQTGEGKTVVTGAAAAVRALVGCTTHVATTNGYLAARDFEEMQATFELLEISAGLLPEKMDQQLSRDAYTRQITYGPGYQFGFDFLFDQITLRKFDANRIGHTVSQALSGFDINRHLVQCRAFDTVIIDEADSVLVDEATTPLILSFETGREISDEPYRLADALARNLVDGEDYTLDADRRAVELTDAGKETIRSSRAGRLTLDRPWEEYIKSAMYARHFLIRDEHYVVQDGEVNIVDQFTGRIFEDRSWESGLHQAVEMKEGVTVNPGRESRARITRQRFIGFYKTLCGLSGTASGVQRDLHEFYNVSVFSIPTHRPSRRTLQPPRCFADQQSKLDAIVDAIATRHRSGQPILVGTRTIGESTAIFERLNAERLPVTLLNGVQDREEAEIVAEAGCVGAITIATNMAGRGTDIKLPPESLDRGGLHVIGATPNLSERIDRQLVGRAARQGQPGSAQFFVAADDDLIDRYAPKLKRRLQKTATATGESSIEIAPEIAALQQHCDNVEFNRRRDMVQHDRWLDTIRDTLFGDADDA